MTQATNRPSTATRRTGGSQPSPHGDSLRGEQDLRDTQDLVGNRDRDDGSDRDDRTRRDEQNSYDEQSEPRRQPGGVQRTVEQVTDRARSATSVGVDALAPTPDMSKVVTAWFDMAGDMMKLQQQFVATVLGAGTTNDHTTTKV
jgi:hypothetical protein